VTTETNANTDQDEQAQAEQHAAESPAPDANAGESQEAQADAAPTVDALEQVKAEAHKYRDQLLRTAADFDNFRKRTRKDLDDARRKGLESALLEVLPVADNLERALEAASQTSDVAAIVDGVRMVLRFFEDALNRLGVQRVDAVGYPFDPSVHEAVQQIETDETPPGTIVSEMMAGYKLGPKLLRAAMVSVARPPQSTASAPPAAGSDSPEA
jgi:molecular chaperone GrpE